MNLVAHEYVACQDVSSQHREGRGVLVLSEFAGAAQSLSGAVRINPWNTDEVANGVHEVSEGDTGSSRVMKAAGGVRLVLGWRVTRSQFACTCPLNRSVCVVCVTGTVHVLG